MQKKKLMDSSDSCGRFQVRISVFITKFRILQSASKYQFFFNGDFQQPSVRKIGLCLCELLSNLLFVSKLLDDPFSVLFAGANEPLWHTYSFYLCYTEHYVNKPHLWFENCRACSIATTIGPSRKVICRQLWQWL